MLHDVEHAFHPGTNAGFLKAQRLACFVGDNWNALGLGHFPQCALPQYRIDDYRHAEGIRHGRGVVIGQVRTDLRQVGAMDSTGVKIHRMGSTVQYLGLELPGHTRAQAAGFRARKATIQIAAIGQVAGLVNKTEYVHHRHRQQGAAERLERRMTQQTTDDFHPVEFISMDSCTDHQNRSGATTMDHMDRHIQRRLRIKLCQGQLHFRPRPRLNRNTINLKRLVLRLFRIFHSSPETTNSHYLHPAQPTFTPDGFPLLTIHY